MNATLHFGKYDCFIELYRPYSYTTFPDRRFYKLYEENVNILLKDLINRQESALNNKLKSA